MVDPITSNNESSGDRLAASDIVLSPLTSRHRQIKGLNKTLQRDLMKKSRSEESIWALCARMVWKREKAIVDSANDELNALLIFAGLFSAIVTAFLVPFYPSLTPVKDLAAQTLSMISTQLKDLSFTVASGYINSTHPVTSNPVVATTETAVDPDTISVSALWFSALVFSLAAALIAIFVKQWLNRHAMPITSMPRQSVLVWYCRHRSFEKWGVTAIVGTVPILLQIALILFLVGLVLLLRTLNETIFILITTLFGILLTFSLTTTVIPSFVAATADCPYKSPQALLVLFIVSGVSAIASGLINGILFGKRLDTLKFPSWLQHLFPSIAKPRKNGEQLELKEPAMQPDPLKRRSTQEVSSLLHQTGVLDETRGRSMIRGRSLGWVANTSLGPNQRRGYSTVRPYSPHREQRCSPRQASHNQLQRVLSQPSDVYHPRELSSNQRLQDRTEMHEEAQKYLAADVEGSNWIRFISSLFRIILGNLQLPSKVHRNWSQYEYDIIRTGDIAAIPDSTLLVAADAAVLNDRILFKVVQPYVKNPQHSLADASEALLGILRNREKTLYIGPALGASLDGMTVNLLERLAHDAKNATTRVPEIPPRLVDLVEKLLSLSRPAVYDGLLAFYQIYSGLSRKAPQGVRESSSLRIMELILGNVQRFSGYLDYDHFDILISYIPRMFDGDDVDIPSFIRITMEVLLSCWDLPADDKMHIRQELRKKFRWLMPVIYATTSDLSTTDCNPLRVLEECLEVAIKRGSYVIKRLGGHIQTMEDDIDGLQTEIASWRTALEHVRSSVMSSGGSDGEMRALESLKTQMILGLKSQIEHSLETLEDPDTQVAPGSQKSRNLQGIMTEIKSWQRALEYPRTTIVTEPEGQNALKELQIVIDSWHPAFENLRSQIAERPLTSSEGRVTLQWAGEIEPGWMAEIAQTSNIHELRSFLNEQVERLPRMKMRLLEQWDELVKRKNDMEGQLYGLEEWQDLIPKLKILLTRDSGQALGSVADKLPMLFLKEADVDRLHALFPDRSLNNE